MLRNRYSRRPTQGKAGATGYLRAPDRGTRCVDGGWKGHGKNACSEAGRRWARTSTLDVVSRVQATIGALSRCNVQHRRSSAGCARAPVELGISLDTCAPVSENTRDTGSDL